MVHSVVYDKNMAFALGHVHPLREDLFTRETLAGCPS